jgi:hypothetical protein
MLSMAAGPYRITVAGELGELGSAAFAGLDLSIADGQTEVSGIRDQAELRAALERVWDLGLDLIRVEVA